VDLTPDLLVITATLFPLTGGWWFASSVPPLIIMFPLQEQRPLARKEKFKNLLRNPSSLFSSSRQATQASPASPASRTSRLHDSPPNTTNIDVVFASSSRHPSISTANVSSRTDLVSGNDSASKPKSALGAAGPGKCIDQD
jgi:hypothetical protein